jgi:hypothetical protein
MVLDRVGRQRHQGGENGQQDDGRLDDVLHGRILPASNVELGGGGIRTGTRATILRRPARTGGTCLVNGQIQYGNARPLTSGGTPAVANDGTARLGTFRHEVRRAGRQPNRSTLLHLIERARALGLRDEDIRSELTEIRVSLEALDFADRLTLEGLPIVPSVDRLPAGEHCHFATPVRFGRRRADQIGHVELTSSWLKFHGALDVSVVWSAVARVEREGPDILVSLLESRRVLRFSCHSAEEAARGTSVARHLVAGAASCS